VAACALLCFVPSPAASTLARAVVARISCTTVYPPPQEKIALRAGLGDKTAVCPAIQSGDAQQLGIEAARFEFGATCFPAIQEVMDKAGVRPHQIDFIVTNSSLL
jgi:hypothetical protein